MTDAQVQIEVEVDPATAFEVFTREIGKWWRGDLSLAGVGGELRFEPGVGGRVLSGEDEVGKVTVWETGPRLAFSLGATEVDVRFEAVDGGTRVVLRHGGWEQGWAGQLAGFARHSLEHALLRRLGEFLDAIASGDVAFFERAMTDDALLIFPGAGNVYDKATGIASMADHPPYTKYDVDNPRIVHLGDSAAVLTHHATVMHTQHDEPRALVVTTVLVHEHGEWRLALHQWTPADDN